MATIGKQLTELPLGKYLTISKVAPTGSLAGRKLVNGVVMFYWRYTLNEKTEREPIGTYDSSAPPRSHEPTKKGYSIEAATRKARELATLHYTNKDMGGYAALKKAQKANRIAEEEAAQQAAKFTLSRLLDIYCDYLQAQGRDSHRNARSIFNLHIKEAFPQIAAMPANQCTDEHFADMMRRLQEAGKGRTSNKLRSYARAAYEIARQVRSRPTLPLELKAFNVKHNPVADTANEASANKPDKNPLNTQEMLLYWNLIREVPEFKGALLRLHLLTGAQRIEQLTRLKTAEIHDGMMILWDGKGKPGKPPRAHPVPLTALSAKALLECSPSGKYALSTDGGKTRVAPTTLAGWAQAIVGERIPAFTVKRLRSGVETLLARAKVSVQIRGRLQSHGITGVQATHYDGYEYLEEKLEALEILEQVLTKTH